MALGRRGSESGETAAMTVVNRDSRTAPLSCCSVTRPMAR